LVRAALGNLRTWRFAKRIARIFEVTYSYGIVDSKVEFLKESGVVDIAASLPVVNVIADRVGGWPQSQFWEAELTSPSGNASATLFLDKYLGEFSFVLGGYVIGPGSKKQELRDPHQDGDMLGFDMTIQGPDGKPLRVSVLGKKTGNKIAGVFLDYSGTSGTWTAVRQAPAAKQPRQSSTTSNGQSR
jgi:hypothetical protein